MKTDFFGMMNIMNHDTMAQKEALINEYKGNLFEYLVGSSLSQIYGIESEFLESFGGEIKARFSQYESWLREQDPELVGQLPVLAKASAKQLIEYLPADIDKVLVSGKVTAGGGDDIWKEADLILVKDQQFYPISLKLCKANAYVNTKSGGVKSFLSKYFNNFERSDEWQKKLSNIVDEGFLEMGHSLHELAGLEFNGRFDHKWVDAGFSELPGQLEDEMGQLVMQNYYKVIKVLHQALLSFFKDNQKIFISSLAPILGLGSSEMLQLTCFHGEKREAGEKLRYQLKDFHLFRLQDFEREVTTIEFKELKDNISSFEIHLSSLILQVRVKPMNKFTVPGLKVNCSVKQR